MSACGIIAAIVAERGKDCGSLHCKHRTASRSRPDVTRPSPRQGWSAGAHGQSRISVRQGSPNRPHMPQPTYKPGTETRGQPAR